MSDAQIIALARKHGLLWPDDPAYVAFARELLERSETATAASPHPLAASRRTA